MSGESSEEITLLIEDQQIKCQKSLLAENSDFFKNLFEGDWSERGQQSFEITGVKYDALANLVKKLQDKSYEMDDQQLVEVLELACQYFVHALIEICQTELVRLLNTSNCIRIWFQIQKFYVPEMKINEIYIKAKGIALDQFMVVKDNESLNDLDVDTVRRYLGNEYLQTDYETDVFNAIMAWVRACSYAEGNDLTDILMKLLLCMDFTGFTREDITERIMETTELKNCNTVCDVLNCYLQILDLGEPAEVYSEEVVNHARLLSTCKQRKKWDKAPCILVEVVPEKIKGINPNATNTTPELSLVYFDNDTDTFKKLVDVERSLRLTGVAPLYGIRACNGYVFIFGASDGTTYYHTKCFEYDIICRRWKLRKSETPKFSTHIESCVVDNKIFVVDTDGTKCWAHRYNTNTDEWSERYYIEPARPYALKCCKFDNKCLVANIADWYQFFFNETDLKFEDVSHPEHPHPEPPPDKTWERYVQDLFRKHYFRLVGCFQYEESFFMKRRNNHHIFSYNKMDDGLFSPDHLYPGIIQPHINDRLRDRMELVKCNDLVYTLTQRYVGDPQLAEAEASIVHTKDYTYTLEQVIFGSENINIPSKVVFEDLYYLDNPLLIDGKKYIVAPSMRIFEVSLCNVPQENTYIIDF